MQYLNLWSRHVTTMVRLKTLTALQVLNIYDTQVTDAGLVHLNGLTALQQLGLGLTKVTTAGVRQLKKSPPNLRVHR